MKSKYGVLAATGLLGIVLASCGGSSSSENGSKKASDDSVASEESTDTTAEEDTSAADDTTDSTVVDDFVDTTVAKPASFKVLSDREWKIMNRNPDAMSGSGVKIAGLIIQFDAFTGTNSFKAVIYNSRAARDADRYLNNLTIADISGDEALLSNFLKGDKFVCDCVINRADSYTTQDGGTKLTILMDAVNLTAK